MKTTTLQGTIGYAPSISSTESQPKQTRSQPSFDTIILKRVWLFEAKRAMHNRIHMPEELAEIPDSQPDSPKDFRLHPIDIVRKLFTNIAFIN